jgi:hypothetical protein
MTFVDKSFRQMMEEIEFQRFIRHDRISPYENPELFGIKEGEYDGKKIYVITSDYCRGIIKKLQLPHMNVRVNYKSDGKQSSPKYSVLVDSIIAEAMINGYERGHNCDDRLKLSLRVAEGEEGYILRFRDHGPGFDYKDKIYLLRTDQPYWQRLGAGFSLLDAENIEASYEGNGNILNVKLVRDKNARPRIWDRLQKILGGRLR